MLDVFAAAPPDVARAFRSRGARPRRCGSFLDRRSPDNATLQPRARPRSGRSAPGHRAVVRLAWMHVPVSLKPGAELEDVVLGRGYRRGDGFMRFRRGVGVPPVRQRSLRSEQVHETKRLMTTLSLPLSSVGLRHGSTGSPLSACGRSGGAWRTRRRPPHRRWRGALCGQARVARRGRDAAGRAWPWCLVGDFRRADPQSRSERERRRLQVVCALRSSTHQIPAERQQPLPLLLTEAVSQVLVE